MDIDLLNQSITEKLIGDCFLQVSTKVQVVIVDTHSFDILHGFSRYDLNSFQGEFKVSGSKYLSFLVPLTMAIFVTHELVFFKYPFFYIQLLFFIKGAGEGAKSFEKI